MATEDSGCTATVIWPREMDLWLTKEATRLLGETSLISEAEDLRVSVVLGMVIMLALVGRFMVTLATLELEEEGEEEGEWG